MTVPNFYFVALLSRKPSNVNIFYITYTNFCVIRKEQFFFSSKKHDFFENSQGVLNFILKMLQRFISLISNPPY